MSNQGQLLRCDPLHALGHFPLDDLSHWTTRRRNDGQLGHIGRPAALFPCCRAAWESLLIRIQAAEKAIILSLAETGASFQYASASFFLIR
jgi:hypothetical protein